MAAETLLTSATGRLKWPDDAVLFTLPSERELLPDKARRLMFQTYLKLANLKFVNKVAPNCDYMSPSGSAPFLWLKFGSNAMIFSDFESMASFLRSQQLGLTPTLSLSDCADMEAYMSLIRAKVAPAEEYQTWFSMENFKKFSLKTHGYGLPWPLHTVVPRLQQLKYIWNHWDSFRRPQNEILKDFEQACQALSERLGNKKIFFDVSPTVLDAMVYGHLKAVVSMSLPSNELSRVVMQYKNLREYLSGDLAFGGQCLADNTLNTENAEKTVNS